MPIICEFQFNRLPAIYYGGEEISGNLTLTTRKDLKVGKMFIQCKGGASVHWLESSPNELQFIQHNDGADVTSEDILHRGQEKYVDDRISLVEGQTTIAAGRHEYAFAFELPLTCAATCDQKYGAISYSVGLSLKRPTKFDKNFEQRFVVRSRLDLNADGEECKHPRTVSCSLNGAPCTTVHFSTPRTGYVPGQRIPVSVQLSAGASEEVGPTKTLKVNVRLCRKWVFRSQQPREKRKEVIGKLAAIKSGDIGGGGGGSNHSFENSLLLPLLSPTTSRPTCTVMQVLYYLETLVFDKRMKLLAKLYLPITVGTEALRDHRGLRGPEQPSLTQETSYCYDNPKVVSRFQFIKDREETAEAEKSFEFLNFNSDRSPLLTSKSHAKSRFISQIRDILRMRLYLSV